MKLKRRPSWANVASTLALLIAVGVAVTGTAFSVGSAVPGKNGVKTNDIAPNAVTAPKVKNLGMVPLNYGTGDCAAPGPGSYYTLAAGKDAQGVVHLQGGAVSCSGATIAVLPAQFRPTKTLELVAFSGGSPQFAGSVVISPNGTITNSSGTNGGIHHLDGITYKP